MVTIHPTAVIGPNVEIEDDVYIGPLCVIGFPAEWNGREGEDKGVLICRGARLTGLVTVDSGVERQTVIGERCYLMKHSHVGHDANLVEDVIVSCGAKIGGHAEIMSSVNIGLNAVIHQRQRIEACSMIGMGAVITKGLKTVEFGVYVGNPARFLRENTSHRSYSMSKTIEYKGYIIKTEEYLNYKKCHYEIKDANGVVVENSLWYDNTYSPVEHAISSAKNYIDKL